MTAPSHDALAAMVAALAAEVRAGRIEASFREHRHAAAVAELRAEIAALRARVDLPAPTEDTADLFTALVQSWPPGEPFFADDVVALEDPAVRRALATLAEPGVSLTSAVGKHLGAQVGRQWGGLCLIRLRRRSAGNRWQFEQV